MSSPRSHEPVTAEAPLSRALGQSVKSSEVLDIENIKRAVHPADGDTEVIPSGNFPKPQRATDLPQSRTARSSNQQSGVPTRATVGADDTEIISTIPDPDAFPRRRRTRNRKASSPLRLLGLFAAAQLVLGLIFFLLFGSMIRGWMQDSAVPSDGVSAQDARILRDEVREADARFGAIGSDVETIKKQLSVSPGDAWAQLEVLGQRNELTLLADDAITNGNRLAFDQLIKSTKDSASDQKLRDGAAAELSRVKIFYASLSRLGSYALPVATLYPSLKTEAEESLSVSQLLRLLRDKDKDWRVRARAAYLLGGQRNLAVAEALVRTAKDDPNLDVVKECVVSFEENTGFRSKGMFEIDELDRWWQTYESRVSSAPKAISTGS